MGLIVAFVLVSLVSFCLGLVTYACIVVEQQPNDPPRP